MKVLVTGANGFLGSHLVEALLAEGDDVVAWVRPRAELRHLQGARSRITLCQGSLRDPEALARAVSGVDVVCHLAGTTRALPESLYDEINVGGTRTLLAACRMANPAPRRFVLSSSLAAGGPAISDHPKRETDPDSPRSAYGRSKLRAEEALFAGARQMEAVALRPGPIYGPRDTYFFEVLRLATRRLFMRVGPAHALYNFCYATDAAQAFVLACRAPDADGRVLYVGGDTNYRAPEFERVIATSLGVRRPLVVPLPNVLVRAGAAIAETVSHRQGQAPPLNRDKARDLTAGSWGIDISEASRLLGWRPRLSFPEGLGLTVAWYRAKGWL